MLLAVEIVEDRIDQYLLEVIIKIVSLSEAIQEGVEHLNVHRFNGFLGYVRLDQAVEVLQHVRQSLLLRFVFQLFDHNLAILDRAEFAIKDHCPQVAPYYASGEVIANME